ncbi:Kelch repeat-containing protein [Myxococcus stipitatus]|uniref:Kelch repeat-containing protein n=1 Tax=Myxococcus stipitatus TaxID=83455 RepID=UPI0030D1DC31
MTRVISVKKWLGLGLCGALMTAVGAPSALAGTPGAGAATSTLSPWSSASRMSRVRAHHTATRLLSGDVLVTGGRDWSAVTATAETYSAALNTWSPSPSMNQARWRHTATLLPDGKVLVAGGGGASALSSAELYDPATNTWSATGSMGSARQDHRAVLLANGKVLVFGGYSPSALKSAELYDPATGLWTPTGSTSVVAGKPSATRLPDGNVLVVSDNGVDTAAEVYRAGTGTWSRVADPPAFSGHAAVLLNQGAVLVTGLETGQYASGAWLFWPLDNEWEYVSYANEARRMSHSMTLLPSGKVLVARGTRNQIGGSAEIFDPANWTLHLGGEDSPTQGHTATLLTSGKVLVVGGSSQEEPELYSSAELYTE